MAASEVKLLPSLAHLEGVVQKCSAAYALGCLQEPRDPFRPINALADLRLGLTALLLSNVNVKHSELDRGSLSSSGQNAL